MRRDGVGLEGKMKGNEREGYKGQHWEGMGDRWEGNNKLKCCGV